MNNDLINELNNKIDAQDKIINTEQYKKNYIGG